jgi:hypothetical protein
MARPKEFERDTALDDAIAIFCDHGYEGTSTDALLGKMGISRQSLYDTSATSGGSISRRCSVMSNASPARLRR